MSSVRHSKPRTTTGTIIITDNNVTYSVVTMENGTLMGNGNRNITKTRKIIQINVDLHSVL